MKMKGKTQKEKGNLGQMVKVREMKDRETKVLRKKEERRNRKTKRRRNKKSPSNAKRYVQQRCNIER